MTNRSAAVDDYIGTRSATVGPLMQDLRTLIHTTMPGTTEDMQYGVPVFLNAHGIPVLYLFGSKKHVNFGFLRSKELADPNGTLKGSGEPSKHIRVLPGQPIETEVLTGFVRQCERIVS